MIENLKKLRKYHIKRKSFSYENICKESYFIRVDDKS